MMLAIVLAILKGIGWLLLGIVLVLFFLIALILISPLRYDVTGEQTDEITGAFAVSWLFGIIKVWGDYKKEKMNLQASLFGISLLGRKKKKKRKRKGKKGRKGKKKSSAGTNSKKPKPQKPKELAAEQVDDVPMKEAPKPEKKKPIPEKIEHTTPAKRVKVSEIEEKEPELTKEEKKAEKAKQKVEKKIEREAKKEAFDEKKEMLLKYWVLSQMIADKKKILGAVVKLLKRLIKGILPKDIFIKGTVGLGEPELTGYVLALAGILVGKFGNHIAIKGDFTKFVIEDVRLQIRGRIVFGYLVYALLAFVLTKPVRKLIWKIRKGMVEENG